MGGALGPRLPAGTQLHHRLPSSVSTFVDIDVTPGPRARWIAMDPRDRATSVWFRVAGLLRRKEIVIEITEAEIRSAQQEVCREAAKLVLMGDAIEIARRMHDRAERVIKRG